MADTRRTGPGTGVNTDDYSEQMLVCIQNCQDCHRACLQTLAYCMKRGGRHARPDHLRVLMDCADICLVSAAFMIRASDLHVHTCAACAAVCQRCADACAAMGDDSRMKALADTCQLPRDGRRARRGGSGRDRGRRRGDASRRSQDGGGAFKEEDRLDMMIGRKEVPNWGQTFSSQDG